MLFHTWTFIIFFLIVLAGFFALRHTRFWIPWLLLASYVFYGGWNPYYLVLIFYSTSLDFVAVTQMSRCPTAGGRLFRNRRFWLIASVTNNLAILAFFKYADFVIGNLNSLAASFGLNISLPEAGALMPFGWEYLLPVGISFYTFQSMSYTIDFYRGHIQREPNFLRYATFVSFFPQLVAGPIERASHLLPQFRTFPEPRLENFTDGASLFLTGLFKKVALANYLALYVERIYVNPAAHDAPALCLATFCFAWQIYFDFSGYTDMARGVGRIMGFRLMKNFHNPYLARGLGDFWARWHISLSTWFRDYLYVPLGGNRHSPWITYRNLFLVFVISGFWHGAAWTFIIWGTLHALGLMATRQLERSVWYSQKVPSFLKQSAVFIFVCFTWIFFRAETLPDAWLIMHRLALGAWTDPACPALLLGLVAAVWLYQFLYESRLRPLLEHAPAKVGLATAMILYLLLGAAGGGEFIYFQF